MINIGMVYDVDPEGISIAEELVSRQHSQERNDMRLV